MAILTIMQTDNIIPFEEFVEEITNYADNVIETNNKIVVGFGDEHVRVLRDLFQHYYNVEILALTPNVFSVSGDFTHPTTDGEEEAERANDEDGLELDEEPHNHNPNFRSVPDLGSVFAFPACPPVAEEADAIVAMGTMLGADNTSRARLMQDKLLRMHQLMGELTSLHITINALQSSLEGNPLIQKIVGSLDLIRQDSMVENAFLSGTHGDNHASVSFVIQTKEIITIPHPNDGFPRNIGKMEFRISVNALLGQGVNTTVLIRNLTRELIISQDGDTPNGFQCPHVKLDGRACFGDQLSHMIIQAISQTDIQLVLTLLINFIKNPNPHDDWGRFWDQWPKVTEGHQ